MNNLSKTFPRSCDGKSRQHEATFSAYFLNTVYVKRRGRGNSKVYRDLLSTFNLLLYLRHPFEKAGIKMCTLFSYLRLLFTQTLFQKKFKYGVLLLWLHESMVLPLYVYHYCPDCT
jgi:hypothetical protein